MIKKIDIEQLQVGMFVHDLNCGWMEHGFLRNRFLVKSEGLLEKVRDLGTRELYIDTDKGLDISQAPTELEVEEALEQDLAQVAAGEVTPEEQIVSLAEERIQARRIHNEALGLLSSLNADIKSGRPVDLEHITPLADDILDSVLRNRDALMGFSRVRRLGRYQLEHSVNVAALLTVFGQSLGLDREVLSAMTVGGLLHDIGKTYLPTALLNKPDRLTPDEIEIMRKHVADGFRVASGMPGIPKVALAIIAEHHERMDGSGYPHRRKGDEITRYGQMAAIVDVYDAISSDRVYNKALGPHEALRKMLEWSAYHFNPELVQQFIRCLGIYPLGTLVRLRSGRLGVVVESGRNGPFQPVVRVVMDASRRSYIGAQDIDLSRLGKGSEERILKAESPKQWDIDPVEVLKLPS